MDRFKSWLNAPEDGRKLGLFRIIFGLCMVFRMLDYYKVDFIQKGILAPKMHFTFEGFAWVRPLPNAAMQAILAAMLVAAVLLLLGRWMRMVTIPNQSSVAKAYDEFDENGAMKDSPYRERVVDVMEELFKFTVLLRHESAWLTDRHSERRAPARAPVL